MSDVLVNKFKEIVAETNSAIELEERANVQSILKQHVAILSDVNIKGIRIEWCAGSLHLQVSIAAGDALQTVLYCLHKDCALHSDKDTYDDNFGQLKIDNA
jgi:hypothetical protein